MKKGRDWNEASLSEDPGIGLLERLGYTYIAPEVLEAERGTLKEVFLVDRLTSAVKRLNPWISEGNLQKAVRSVTGVQAASLIEANEKLYTILTYGISLEQDVGSGKRGQTVRFIDFEKPEKNELIVTRQFSVKGAKATVRPDAVILVNGIPVVLIECKSPTLGEGWIDEAVTQVQRYQESSEDFKYLGAPRLFHSMQLIVLPCGQAARYGTVGTPQRFFAEWKTAYPLNDAEVEKIVGRKPSPQDTLFVGLLRPAHVLDVMRNFTAFERDATTGKTIRKVCRYQQFKAVNKALDRATRGKKAEERGGVVWHTQGSGKSLTMLWLALKLRRDSRLENPAVVIVTDRRDLDEQISKTFLACGFPNPKRVESVRDLRASLKSPTGKTLMTTVQKFQDQVERNGETSKRKRVEREEHPLLSEDANVFVMVDEAHRTQYGGLAANMRKALPNAAFVGFTGTPIDKKDRSTPSTFGPYLDTYTIEQAVADGATVPIFYESRLPEVRIIGQSLDKLFDRTFADRTKEEREAIKKKYATEAAIATAPRRIEQICLDLLDHYTKFIEPNGFKAQVVTISREAAIAYKEALDRLHGPPSRVVFSSQHNDEARFVAHATTAEERKAIVEDFLKPEGVAKLLVVCDMLLTGFDAPIEQVMYLDSPLREHTLLQAIARVNRPAAKKNYGLVVDYWGVSEALQDALKIFAPEDVLGAMAPKSDALPPLQAWHRTVMRFFDRVKEKNDLDRCVAVLEPEDVRSEFDAAFKKFGKALDMLLPDPKALPYRDDLRWLGKIRASAAARFRDDRLDISDCGAKVRKLIEDAIVSDGIQILVKRVSLFSKEFDDKLDALKGNEAKASEMEHAVRKEITVRLEENPAFYASLRERLEQIIADRKAARIEAAEQLRRLEALVKEIRGQAEVAEKVGLSETAFAIYGLLQPDGSSLAGEAVATYKINEANKELASLIEEAIEPHTALVDWVRKEDVQREMRKQIKRRLKAAQVAHEKVDVLTTSILELAKARAGR